MRWTEDQLKSYRARQPGRGSASEPADDTIKIVLHGEPAGKGRPRFRVITPRAGKSFASVYTPKETRTYEDALKVVGSAAMGKRAPLIGPLDVIVTAWMPVPKSWSNKKRDAALSGTIWPTVTPDWDNIAKMLDGLNGIVFVDDKQIVRGSIAKLYGEVPRLEILVRDLSDLLGIAGTAAARS